jgi:hypothetical protein
MRSFIARSGVTALVAAIHALSAAAVDFTKLLPDDTDLVLVVNVRQIVSSAAFTKHYRPLVDGFLKSDVAQIFLKGSGFNPLKDLDRVVVAVGRTSYGQGPKEQASMSSRSASSRGALILPSSTR